MISRGSVRVEARCCLPNACSVLISRDPAPKCVRIFRRFFLGSGARAIAAFRLARTPRSAARERTFSGTAAGRPRRRSNDARGMSFPNHERGRIIRHPAGPRERQGRAAQRVRPRNTRRYSADAVARCTGKEHRRGDSVMDRRTLLCASTASLLAPPLARGAQHPKAVPRIGYLSGAYSCTGPVSSREAFWQGLNAIGYVEGRSIAIECRSADGRVDRLSDLAAELRPTVDRRRGGRGGRGWLAW